MICTRGNYLQIIKLNKIVYIGIKNTSVTYNGIGSLWYSNVIGSQRYCDLEHHPWTGKPISIVDVDIDKSKAFYEHQYSIFMGESLFPLPLRSDFIINYPSKNDDDKMETITGYKDVRIRLNDVLFE